MIPTPAQPKKRYGIGAVNYHTGQTVLLIRRRKRRRETAELLEVLLEKPSTERVYVAWDNSNTHEDDEIRRRDVIISQLTDRIPAIEAQASPEPPESPTAATEQPSGAPQPQASTGDTLAATEGASEAEPSLLWERVAVVTVTALTIILALVMDQLPDESLALPPAPLFTQVFYGPCRATPKS